MRHCHKIRVASFGKSTEAVDMAKSTSQWKSEGTEGKKAAQAKQGRLRQGVRGRLGGGARRGR